MSKVAIIGGSAAALLPVNKDAVELDVTTPWGKPSAPLLSWQQGGHEMLFLRRHGVAGTIPPHGINYRANIGALREAAVDYVIATNAVGGIAADTVPGAVVLPEQLIDYTWGREHTFFDGAGGALEFAEFTQPFDSALRDRLVAAAGSDCVVSGCYAVTQGPRLETAAEIDRLEQAGCSIVGMTLMPEAGLAREAGLSYATVCGVVNYAAGRSATAIHAEIEANLAISAQLTAALIDRFIAAL